MYKVLILGTLLLSGCGTKTHTPDPKAVAISKKVIKMLMPGVGDSTVKKNKHLLVLRILDSATAIDPLYNAGYTNKLSSLIYLKRYQQAINTVDTVLKNDPNSVSTWMRGGYLYREYIKDKEKERKYFKTAYDIGSKQAVAGGHRDSKIEFYVALCSAYLNGKSAALKYLDSVYSYYTSNPEDVQSFKYVRNMLNSPFETVPQTSVFDSWNLITY